MTDHPTKTTLTLSGGQEYDVLFCWLGMIRAEELGYDVFGKELSGGPTPEEAEEAAEAKKAPSFMRRMLEDVWIGVLGLQEGVPFEALARQVRTAEDFAAVARCYAHVTRYQKPEGAEEAAAEVAHAEAEGNAGGG